MTQFKIRLVKAEAPASQQNRVQYEQDEKQNLQAYPQQCADCIWNLTGTTCEAFPDGIPTAILLGVFDHTYHYEDDDHDDNGMTKLTEAQLADYQLSPVTELVLKANPYRDAEGKFTSKDKASEGGADTWEKTGKQLGSNKGGIYTKGGEKHYVKFPREKGQIYAEQASDQVHEAMGIKTLNHQATKVNGETASVTKWQDVEPLGEEGWTNMSDKHIQQAADIFMASVLTKNWDVVGLTYDNIGKNKDDDLVILDTGGSFKYRAMGGPKPYDADVEPELQAMTSKEKTSGRVFRPLVRKHMDAFINAAEKLKAVPDDTLRTIAGTMRDPKMPDTIVARKKALLEQFGVD